MESVTREIVRLAVTSACLLTAWGAIKAETETIRSRIVLDAYASTLVYAVFNIWWG